MKYVPFTSVRVGNIDWCKMHMQCKYHRHQMYQQFKNVCYVRIELTGY